MIKILQNISFLYKLTFPVVLTLLLVGLLLNLSNSATEELIDVNSEIVNEGLLGSHKASAILQEFQDFNGLYYRYLTEQTAELLDDGLEKMMDLKRRAIKLNDNLTDFAKLEEGARRQEILDLQTEFVDTVIGNNDDGVFDVSAQMMEIDVEFVLRGAQKYSALYDKFQEVLQSTTDRKYKFAVGLAEYATQKAADNSQRALIISLVAAFFVVMCSVVIVYTTLQSIKSISHTTEELARGNTDIDADTLKRHDELGDIVNGLLLFRERQIQMARIRVEQEKIEAQIKQSEEEEIRNKLADSFKSRVQTLIHKVSDGAKGLTKLSEQITHVVAESVEAADSALDEASHTNSNVQSVAMSVNEMSETAKEISGQIHKSNELVSESVRSVKGADKQAHALSDATDQVSNVILIISDISEQINLLALNATIESARAGDAGKGFAVVASEVKNLANQTSESIQQINVSIEEMNVVSANFIEMLVDINKAIDSISDASGGIASAVEEQTGTASSISDNMQSASDSTSVVSTNLENISNKAAASLESSQGALEAAKELSDLSDLLDKEVESFLEEIHS